MPTRIPNVVQPAVTFLKTQMYPIRTQHTPILAPDTYLHCYHEHTHAGTTTYSHWCHLRIHTGTVYVPTLVLSRYPHWYHLYVSLHYWYHVHTHTGTIYIPTLVPSMYPYWYHLCIHTGTVYVPTLVLSRYPHWYHLYVSLHYWYHLHTHTGTIYIPTLVPSICILTLLVPSTGTYSHRYHLHTHTGTIYVSILVLCMYRHWYYQGTHIGTIYMNPYIIGTIPTCTLVPNTYPYWCQLKQFLLQRTPERSSGDDALQAITLPRVGPETKHGANSQLNLLARCLSGYFVDTEQKLPVMVRILPDVTYSRPLLALVLVSSFKIDFGLDEGQEQG